MWSDGRRVLEPTVAMSQLHEEDCRADALSWADKLELWNFRAISVASSSRGNVVEINGNDQIKFIIKRMKIEFAVENSKIAALGFDGA